MTEHYPRRVPPFGNLGVKDRKHLVRAYRSWPRPSSLSGAKASTLHPSSPHQKNSTTIPTIFRRVPSFFLLGSTCAFHAFENSLRRRIAITTLSLPRVSLLLRLKQYYRDIGILIPLLIVVPKPSSFISIKKIKKLPAQYVVLFFISWLLRRCKNFFVIRITFCRFECQ